MANITVGTSGENFTTIQAAIDAAGAGDTIVVSAGTYASFVIDPAHGHGADGLTIVGQGTVTIEGNFRTANGLSPSDSVADFIKTATAYSDGGSSGAMILGNNITLQNLTITSFANGIELGDGMYSPNPYSLTGLTLTNVTLTGNLTGINKESAVGIDGLTINGGTITDGHLGTNFMKTTTVGQAGVGNATNVTIDGTAFSHLTEKGIYVETLSHATITNVTMDDVGQYGRSPSFGASQVGQFGTGIDINLKNGAYSDITISGFAFTGVGASDQDGAGSAASNGAGIAVKVRDDGSYSSAPATFTGSVVIENGTIDDTSTGIRAGEPGKNVAGPALDVDHVGITNEAIADFDNVTQSAVSVTGSAAADTYTTAASSTGVISFHGGDGDDSFTGHAEKDIADYSGSISASDLTANGTSWTVNAGAEGTDTLTGVEVVHSASGNILLVGSGGYATIQAAIDAAGAGDTILVAAGTYNENLSVNKAVSILGANHGVNGNATRGAETIITGQTVVTAAATLDGLRIENHSNNVTQFIGVSVQTNQDVTIENSVFFSYGVNGAAEDRAINLDTRAQGHVTIADNLITGDATGKYGSSAAWHRGVWSDGSTSQLDITGNTFDHVRSALNLDGYNDATTNVSHNSFTNDGTGLAFGTATGNTITGVHDNTFSGVDAEFNLSNLTGAQSIDLDATHNTASPSVDDATGVMKVFGSGGADMILGTSGADFLDARDLEDGKADTAANMLDGRGGDDTLIGSNGNDTLKGGTGNDTLDGQGGIDTAVYDTAVGVADITANGSNWTVNAGSDGVDTLTNVEVVHSASGNILLVGSGGFTSIQAAIDAAQAGDTILVAAGTYNENLTIGKALSLVGKDGAVLNAASGDAITLSGDLAAGHVSISNLEVAGNASGSGVYVAQHANVGSLSLDHVNVHGNGSYGVFVDGEGTTDAADAVSITHSVFANNGFNGTNGSAHIKLYGFDGDATLTNLTLTGGSGGVGAGNVGNLPDYGIEFHGVPNADLGSGPPDLGHVTIGNVVMTGDFHKNGLALNNYNDVSGLSVGGVNLSAMQTNWGPVFNIDATTGNIDASGYGITYPSTVPASGFIAELQGDTSPEAGVAQTIVGSMAAEHLRGGGGDDTLRGGGGNDTLEGQGGNDVLVGGGGFDTAIGYDASFHLALGASGWTITNGTETDRLFGVEQVVIDGTATRVAAGILSFAPDTGVSNNGVTTAASITLTGVADSNGTVKIFDGATQVGTATADVGGNWTFATATLAAGDHGFTAVSTTPGNNTGPVSPVFNVHVDAPTASPVTLTASAEDTTRTITAAELLAGVGAIDGPAATISSVSISSGNGTLTQVDATTWSYVPAANDDTSVTFSYTASDGVRSSTSTASLDLTPVNDAPVAVPVTLTASAEDTTRIITAAELLAGVSDVDGPAATITSLSIASGSGTLTQVNATTWSYVPAANDDTSVTFSYTASDGSLSATSTASLDLMPVNDAPVAVPVTLTASAEDTTRIITAAELLAGVSDVDGPAATITSLSIASGSGTLTQVNATTWSYVPAANDDTSVTFSYTASDGSLSATSTASLDLTPVNDAPVAQNDTASVSERQSVTIAATTLLANDTDVDAGDTKAIVSVDGSHSAGTVQFNGTDVVYTAGSQFNTLKAGEIATDTFTYTMRDAAGATSTATVTVTINGTDSTPVISSFGPDTGVTGDGITSATVLTLSGIADHNTSLKIFDGSAQIGVTTSDSSGNWSFQTGTLASGNHGFTAASGSLTSSSLNVRVDAVAANTAPVVNATDGQTLNGVSRAALSLFSVSDAENNTITKYELFDGTADAASGYWSVNGVVQAANQTISVTANQIGQTSFQVGKGSDVLWVRAFDGQDWSAWKSFTVIEPSAGGGELNHAPTVSVSNLTATRGQSFTANALFTGSDSDGDPITKVQFWDSTTASSSGSFYINGVAAPTGTPLEVNSADLGNVNFKAGAGTDLVWARVYDGSLWSDWKSFTVTGPDNHAPTVQASNQTVSKGTTLSASSLFTTHDADGDAIVSYQVWDGTDTSQSGYWVVNGASQTAGHAIDVSAADLASTQFQTGNGTDNLWVRSFDGISWSDWANFTVTGQNHAPVITAADTSINASVAASSLFSTADADGDAITQYQFWDSNAGSISGYFSVNGVVQNANQAITVNASDLSSVTFEAGKGSDLVWFRANDGTTWGDWKSITITEPTPGNVSNNHAPTVSVQNLTATHGQSFDASQLYTGADVDGDTITKVQFWDSTTASSSGHFVFNGVESPSNQAIEVSTSQLSHVTFQSGSGADQLWARVFDGTVWSDWKSFTVTAPVNTAPVVTASNADVTVGQSVQASTLFTVSDADHDTMTRYQFWDSTTTSSSGHFVVNGQVQGTNQNIDVLAADLDHAAFVGGTAAGSDTLWVRAFDGTDWSAWKQFTATTHAATS